MPPETLLPHNQRSKAEQSEASESEFLYSENSLMSVLRLERSIDRLLLILLN